MRMSETLVTCGDGSTGPGRTIDALPAATAALGLDALLTPPASTALEVTIMQKL
jgi:hypothetical protein